MMHRCHLEATSPNAQASGDRLQSKVEENEDVTNLLSTGVKLIPNLVTRLEGNLPVKTLGKLDFPSHHCNVVYFRTRLHVCIISIEQISRNLH